MAHGSSPPCPSVGGRCGGGKDSASPCCALEALEVKQLLIGSPISTSDEHFENVKVPKGTPSTGSHSLPLRWVSFPH
eukprot:scaffold1252_cov124-Isochrysis_galbana.AAC.4